MRTRQTISRRAALFGIGVLVSSCGPPGRWLDEAVKHGRGGPPGAPVDGGPSARRADDVLLVHGAWADGSSWSAVIERLQKSGYTVRAVQLRELSLADDAALVRNAIDQIPRPLVVVGHSYGGAVIGEASLGASNVVALVFAAAFALDEGETINGLNQRFGPTQAVPENFVIDDEGNVLWKTEPFVKSFAAGVPRDKARVLAAVQHPAALGILSGMAATPGWKGVPTFYQVSRADQVISPDLQRFVALRMGAETIELPAGHLSLITHAGEVTALIVRATLAPQR
jgi:pimeloyl-ACP methyl ester carboxylesterase